MRNIFWDFRRSFIGLKFIGQPVLALAKSGVVLLPLYIGHKVLSTPAIPYYDMRDSDLKEL